MTNPIIKKKKNKFSSERKYKKQLFIRKKKKITEIINYNHAFIRKREREKMS